MSIRAMSKLNLHLSAACRSACLAVALSFAFDAALAADPAPGTPRRGEPRRPPAQPQVQPPPRPIEPLLTREQLRGCMALQARNRQLAQDAQQNQARLTAERDELRQLGDALKADAGTLDRTSEEAVNAYNGRVAERERRVGELERAVASFNQMASSHEQGRAAYARDCENRKFDDLDEKAILSGS
jgi:hypothetical protein